MYVDGSLYPDEAPPASFDDSTTRADYLARVCGAWDFGIVPEPATLALLEDWRAVFDRYPLPASVAYHTFRALYGWPSIGPAAWFPPRTDSDVREGRDDPCVELV